MFGGILNEFRYILQEVKLNKSDNLYHPTILFYFDILLLQNPNPNIQMNLKIS